MTTPDATPPAPYPAAPPTVDIPGVYVCPLCGCLVALAGSDGHTWWHYVVQMIGWAASGCRGPKPPKPPRRRRPAPEFPEVSPSG